VARLDAVEDGEPHCTGREADEPSTVIAGDSVR
jgi:hypothetical protein